MATNDLFSEADEAKRQRLRELGWQWDEGRFIWIDIGSRWYTEQAAFDWLDEFDPREKSDDRPTPRTMDSRGMDTRPTE
jgi:hypothetical protein